MVTHTFNSFYGFPSDTIDRVLAGDFTPVADRIVPGQTITPVGEVMARLWALPGEAAWAAIEQLHRLGVPLQARTHANDVDGLMSLCVTKWDQNMPSAEALARIDRWVTMGGPLDQHVWGRTVLGEVAKANPAWLLTVAERGFTRMSGDRPLIDYLAQWGTPASVEKVCELPDQGGLAQCDLGTFLNHLVKRWQPSEEGDALMALAARVARTWMKVADPWQGRLVATGMSSSTATSPVEVLANGLGGLDQLPTCCRQAGSEVDKNQRRIQFMTAWAAHLRPLALALADDAWNARTTLSDARGLWLAWTMKDAERAEQWARFLPRGQLVHVPVSPMAQPINNPATAWVAGYLKLAKQVTFADTQTTAQRTKARKDFDRALTVALDNGVDVMGRLQAELRQDLAQQQAPTVVRKASRPRA